MKKLGFCLLIGLLTGCEPMMFGIPQGQWNQLTPDQKNQVIAGYNQQQLVNAQNAPIQNAINTAGSLIQADQFSHDYHYSQDNTSGMVLPPTLPVPPLPPAPQF